MPFDPEEMDKISRPHIQKKPWMENKNMVLVRTGEEFAAVVDACIQANLYALDLETSGLDNRVFNNTTRAHIVGVCISCDGVTGYYVPIHHPEHMEHCVPFSAFKAEMHRLVESNAVAIFHNGKFDQEFLQFNGGEPLGLWDNPKQWEDTLILAYMRNTRIRQKGLKFLSKTELGMEMIELEELFPQDAVDAGNLNFGALDPTWEPAIWYATSDAICTYLLYHHLADAALKPTASGLPSQAPLYQVEKLCVAATRWMERCRIPISREIVKDLIRIGHLEWLPALQEVYEATSQALGRDVMPGYVRLLLGQGDARFKFNPDDIDTGLSSAIEIARAEAERQRMDPVEMTGKGKYRVNTIPKRVPDLTNPKSTEVVDFPVVYDVILPDALGLMLRELGVQGLRATEKSGQIKTSKDELDRVIEEAGEDFAFVKKVKRFREVAKAISTNLQPIYDASDPRKSLDGRIKINFEAFKVDTGRFSTPAEREGRDSGKAHWNLHSIPSGRGKDIPACLKRIREVVRAQPGWKLYAIDYSGQELRVVTNFSREPLWETEFFRCAGCGHEFDRGATVPPPPEPPPPFCPKCGSDSIGDLHTLTAIALNGPDVVNDPNFKVLRGSSKCVHPDTIIRTGSGFQRLGLLPRQVDAFLPVQGLNVQGPNGFVPLLETYGGGTKPLFHVITRRGVLTCTAEHRVQAEDGRLVSVQSGLYPGVLLPEPKADPISEASWPTITHKVFAGVPEMSLQTNAHLAYVAGLILGDGTKSPSSCAITHGHVDKVDRLGVKYCEWQAIIMEACRAAGFDPEPKNEQVYLGSRHVIRYLAALQIYTLPEDTNGTRRFRIPDWIWEAGATSLKHFLGGLFDTDGTVSGKDKNLSVTTKDPIFAGHIAAALQALGFSPSFETAWNKTYQRWYYRVKLFREDSVHFIPYMRHPGKVARLTAEGQHRKPQCGRRKPNEVLLVLPAGDGECMDLHVDSPDHLYWANGFTSHNSVNFALCYGGGGMAVVRAAGVSKDEGWRIKGKFEKTYKGLAGWWKRQHEFARATGHVLTAFNRRYPVPDIDNPDGGFRSKAERNAVNGPIQGSGSDIMKYAMGLIYLECKKRKWLDLVRMIITIHDELVFEIKDEVAAEAVPVLVDIMLKKTVQKLHWRVPLTVDIEAGQDWTAPWNITKIRYGKQPMPSELEGVFQVISKTTATEIATEEPPSAETTHSEPQNQPEGASVTPTYPSLAQGEPFVFTIPSNKLTGKTLNRVARAIHLARGRGVHPFRLVSDTGESLWEGEEIMVDPTEMTVFLNMPET